MLQDLVTLNESVEAAVVVYLLGDILNGFNSTNMTDQEQLIEVYLAIYSQRDQGYFVLM